MTITADNAGTCRVCGLPVPSIYHEGLCLDCRDRYIDEQLRGDDDQEDDDDDLE